MTALEADSTAPSFCHLYAAMRGVVGIMVLSCQALLLLPARGDDAAGMGFEPMSTGVTVSCRGLAVGSDGAVYVGGGHATLVSSHDSGRTWTLISPDVPPQCDFRDLELTAGGNLLAMSAGPGTVSRVLVTSDGGRTWQTVLQNEDPQGFFNGMSFRDGEHGALVGDAIDGRMTVFLTDDGGLHWHPTPGPEVADGEIGFAASGTGVSSLADGGLRIITGGSKCRCHSWQAESHDWTAVDIGIPAGSPGAGAFSCAFRADGRGIAVGGDYLNLGALHSNVAITADFGATWNPVNLDVSQKDCVLAVSDTEYWMCGRDGVLRSTDAGQSWVLVSHDSFYTIAVAATSTQTRPKASPSRELWLAGAGGAVMRITVPD